MNTHPRRGAFTLIEVLIVVVIMAVLAATIIPQFSSSTADAKESSLKFNMHTLRSQIEMYKVHHLGNYPDKIESGTMPQLTCASNAAGETLTLGTPPNATHPFGPYIDRELPANPFNGSNQVVAVTTAGTKPTGTQGTAGWQYDASTGAIWPNNAEFYATNN